MSRGSSFILAAGRCGGDLGALDDVKVRRAQTKARQVVEGILSPDAPEKCGESDDQGGEEMSCSHPSRHVPRSKSQ